MFSCKRNFTWRLVGPLWPALVVWLTSVPASAQYAPTGDHYAGRTSDTGFAGAVNSQGGYAASVPLDLPPAELALGVDYSNQSLITGARTYDGFGRVLFEADPFPSTQSFSGAYGTTRYFNVDGTPSCFIRGNGLQAFTNATDEVHETYPTCLQHQFTSHTEVLSEQDADSLLAGFAASQHQEVQHVDGHRSNRRAFDLAGIFRKSAGVRDLRV